MVITPVMVPYTQRLGITGTEFFELQAVFGVVVCLTEVPSGYLSDRWGRGKTMVLGAGLKASALTVLYVAEGFWGVLLFEVLVGVAFGLVSGTDISLLYDRLVQTKSSVSGRHRVVANFYLTISGAEAGAGLLCTGLIGISLTAVLTVQLCMGWIGFVGSWPLLSLSMRRNKNDTSADQRQRAWRTFIEDRMIRRWVLNFLCWNLGTFLATWIFQFYWVDIGISATWFGMIWAGYHLAVGWAGRRLLPILQARYRFSTILLGASMSIPIGFLILSGVNGWLGVVIGLLFPMSRGVSQVVYQSQINDGIPSEIRATVNSLVGAFFRFGFLMVGPFVGYGIDHYGVQETLIGLGAVYTALIGLVMIPWVYHLRRDRSSGGS